MKPALERDFWGRKCATPLVLASGTCGYGIELHRAGALSDVAFLVTKATTLRPREGNAPPRIADTGYGMLNSIGLANPGASAVVSGILPELAGVPCGVVVNVAGETLDEYRRVVSVLERSEIHLGYEINVSCPNVSAGGMAFGVDPACVAEVTRAVRSATSRPFSVKLTPNGGDIVESARMAEAEGADAVTVCNTFLGMKMDWKSGRPALSRWTGGYSSPALLPLVVARVWQISGAVRVPVIASGGVWSGEDVLELLSAGAAMVELGTCILRRPARASEIAIEMRSLLSGRP
jgi:dihydroorotate dehydrogenase (NAD+) catalytic subunit